MADYVIGVDGGGSKTHAVLLNKDFSVVDESFSLAANIRNDLDQAYNSITTAVDELIKRNNLDLARFKLGIGVAGYSVSTNLDVLKQRLQNKYSHFKLQSDCHIACLAAHHGQDGAIIICGTGVVAYSIHGKVAKQIGGWGFPHGDLGGGAWLGLEICKLVCKAADTIMPWSPLLDAVYQRFNSDYSSYKTWLLNALPGDFATIARFLPEFMPHDVNAQLVIKHGVTEIQQYITVLQNKSLSLKLVGGVAALYLPYLQQIYPGLVLSDVAPAVGAAYL